MKKTIYCPDIVCESCVKVLTKQFDKTKGITSFLIKNNAIDVDYNPSHIKESELLKLVHSKGYRASFSVFGRKTFSERCKEFLIDRNKYALEYKMLGYAALSLVLLLLIQALLCIAFHKQEPIFTVYGWWIFYLDVAIVSIGAAIWHFHAYRTQITCMIGMMVGMTIGMGSGRYDGRNDGWHDGTNDCTDDEIRPHFTFYALFYAGQYSYFVGIIVYA